MVDFKEIRKAPDGCDGCGQHALAAVEEVLSRIVGAIADEGLGVDHEPGFSLRLQDVPRVQIGRQQDVVG
jgi:hypothetical protein